ncbi:hypothetical protein [Nocardioides marmoraquaticus]
MRTRQLGGRRVAASLAALSAATVGLAGLTTSTTVSASADEPEALACAEPVAPADLEVDQAVNGLTTSRGTAPGAFQGTIIGVLKNGIAPGTDMILADLSSTSGVIEKNGVWSGMSGSPVYADAERTQLVGAVSYTLNEGKTTVAGLTPATAMDELLDDGDAMQAQGAERVALGSTMTSRVAASGAATRSQAASGLRALPTPIAVSGLTQRRFDQLEGWLDDHGSVANGGAASLADGTGPGAEAIVPGGNVVASLGHGYVSAGATGTVTEVCGDEVTAFGHPFNYAGDSTYGLHAADAVGIVPGGTFAGFKLANAGAPVGTVDQDRVAGIAGVLGSLPTYFDVTAAATYRGRQAGGTTRVSVSDLVADAGLANSFAASDRALDRTGKGTATASWTIEGARRDGTPFTVEFSDVYTSTYDVASAPLTRLAQQLSALLSNETEAVTITGLSTQTALSDAADTWRVGRTYRKVGSAWKQITRTSPVVLKAGSTQNVRVELYSRTADTQYVEVPVTASKKSVGRTGRLVVRGGYVGEDEFYFFDESEIFFEEYEEEILGGEIAETVPETIKRLEGEAKNASLATSFTVRGTTTAKKTLSRDHVVSGYAAVPVKVVR